MQSRVQDAPRIIAAGAAGASAETVAVLENDGIAALPTETVYGLCARASSHAAVAKVFAAKGRPAHNPLIVHVDDLAGVEHLCTLSAAGQALAEAFWPGPLTLVARLAREGAVAGAALGGGQTVAVRMPSARFFRDVLSRVGPLVAPSANRSGRVSATSAAAVADDLGAAVDLVVDGGPSPIGLESTVVDVSEGVAVLRHGAITAAQIEAVAGPLTPGARGGPLRSPGMLTSHYAPRAVLRLNVAAHAVAEGEGYVAFGNAGDLSAALVWEELSQAGDLHEAARGLYAALRRLDNAGVKTIAVAPIPAEGIGVAINDRLARAAAPRPDG
ncbi:MAG: L-threonylcarbamoyladenylate synthase [Pseudomonadota bacterium]